jgi:gliding motility-associated-like protein
VVYAWTGANGFTTNSQNLHNVPAGSYSVTVTNDDCPVTLDFTLTQPDTILFEVATTPIVCYGGNNATVDITVLSGGVAPYEALWSNFTTGFHKENVAAGTYTITIQDANGCTVATTIYFAEPPLFGMTPEVRQMSCYGANDASIKLNFEGGVAPISFAWDDNPDAGTERVLLAAGTYTVRISDAQPCSLTRTFVIIEPLLLYLSADVHHALDCQNPNSGGIDVTVNGGTPPYRFAWSNGATTEDLSGVAPNTYLVDVTDEYGCETSSIYTVQRPQPMALTIDTVPSFDCIARQATQVVTASATGGMPPYSYTWSEGTPSGAYGETAEIYRNGMVLLTVTDQRGCTATKVFDVTLSQYGTVSRMVDCYERIYEFDATLFQEHPNDIYTWDFGDGTTASGKRQTHRYARAGTYPVTLTVTNQRCTYSFPSTVQVAGNPYITIEPAPMFCPGDSLLVTASGAQSYLWDNGHTGPSLMITTEGLYSVRGSMENGCYTDTSFTAGLYSLYGYKIQTDRSEITNADPSIYVWTDDTPGAFYTWDFGDGTGEQPGNYLRHFYPDVTSDAQFRICLSVVNPDGCREEDCTLIHANNVLFPNTFSPNGDGVNDVFMSGWKMEVYNRNGVLFYKGSEGWDGTYNGRPVANDTYFYCIFDGTTEGARKNCNYVTVVR